MIRRMFRVLKEDAGLLRAQLLGIVVGAVLQGAGFALLVPILKSLFDGDTGRAWVWTVGLVAVVVVYGSVQFMSQLAGYRAAVGLSRGLFARLGDHIATLPLGWFSGEQVGYIGQLTSKGVIDVMGVPAHLLRPLMTAVITPSTVVALMFIFDWRLALVAVATMPVMALIYRWAAGLVQEAEERTSRAGADAASKVVEFSQSQAVLRAFGRHVEGHQSLDDALMEQRNAGRALLVRAVPGLISFALMVQLAFTLLIVVGVNRTLDGNLAAPELIALLVLAVRFVEPLALAADLGGAVKIARNSLHRMDVLLATSPLPEGDQVVPAADDRGRVELDGVVFSYGEGHDEPVLNDVSITVPPRSMIALVGESGSGKTTITRLIARFWDVDAGAVRVSGIDVRDFTAEALMTQLAMVFQDTYLFGGSIADNLRLACPDATDSDLARAAELARLDEVIERLPGGWETDVGEGGFSLSGGERQRVAIARALLKPAPIVLLDEATAALDPENEAAVQNAIDSLRQDRTVIVIAHRLSTVATADEIVVLDNGGVAEVGSHQELLALGGRYASFWHETSRAAGWRLAPQD